MNIEQFILENREQFDRETPGPRVWQGIEKALDEAVGGQKNEPKLTPISGGKRRLWFLAAAASFLLVGAIGFFMGKNSAAEKPGGDRVALQNVSPEAAEAEQFYVRTISAKTKELETHEYHNDQVNDDLAAIDRAMAELKHELANVPPGQREQLVHALIENYQIKLKILDKVLEHTSSPQPSQGIADSTNLKKDLQHDTKSI